MTKSNMTNKQKFLMYNGDSKYTNIVNLKQVGLYIKNNLEPIDVYYTDRLVFVFDREEATEVFNKWKRYELD